MQTSSGAARPFTVLIGCASEDLPAVRGITQRLQADGLAVTLAADHSATPTALREQLRQVGVVLICLSRRALPGGVPTPTLEQLIELLKLTPSTGRLTMALRLTSCDLPSGLQQAHVLDLFSASGYERLLSRLQSHAAELMPPPAPPPPAAQPTPPALLLEGGLTLPRLERQGLVRRLGRGVARGVCFVDDQHILVISGGGPVLVALNGGPPRWAIDCPTRCAALSPTTRLLALASGSEIALWDLAEGVLLGFCTGHTATVSGLAFAPDGRNLASCSHDRTVRLWRVHEDGHAPAPLAILAEHSDRITSVAFSPDGSLLAAGSADRNVRVWRTLDRARLQTLGNHGGTVECLAFSPDGLSLAAGSRGRQVRLWDTRTWRTQVTLEGHEGAVEALAFSPDSTLVATGSTDHGLRLWRRADGSLLRAVRAHGGPVTGLAFNPAGDRLATVAEDDRLLAWHVHEDTQTAALRLLSGRVSSLALNEDGTLLAICGSDGGVAVHRTDEQGGLQLRQSEHRAAVISAAFTNDDVLISAGRDRTIRACRTASGESRIVMQTHGALQAVGLTPDGQLLACSDSEGTVQLWRLSGSGERAGGQFWRVLRGLRGHPRQIVFGHLAIAVASDEGPIRLWWLKDLADDRAEPALMLQLAAGRARSLAFSRDGELLAAGGENGTIRFWQTRDGVQRGAWECSSQPITSLAFARDGRSLAGGDSLGMIKIWPLGSAARRRAPTTLSGHAGAVEHLLYGSEPGMLVSGSADGTVRFWRV